MSGEFWVFACRFYSLNDVERVCLDLQDRFGQSVNLLLAANWLYSQSRLIDAVAAAEIRSKNSFWQTSVTSPIRGVRRCFREHASALADHSSITSEASILKRINDLRDQIKAVELASERYEIDMLEQRLLKGSTIVEFEPRALLAANIARLSPQDLVDQASFDILFAAHIAMDMTAL